jgi:hypothetical protein
MISDTSQKFNLETMILSTSKQVNNLKDTVFIGMIWQEPPTGLLKFRMLRLDLLLYLNLI